MSETVMAATIDKTDWGPGPWQAEPDKLNWKTRAGLPGMIVRNHLGALCGYAAVNPGHPWHGKDYTDEAVDVDVHGGLTFADRCQEDGLICHVPEPGEPADVWWFGFDTAHFMDFTPGFFARMREIREQVRRDMEARYGHPMEPMPDEDPLNYKTIAYVRAEVERLSEQLVDAGPATWKADRPAGL